MTAAPILDLRRDEPQTETALWSMAAEQALLGCVLIDPGALDVIEPVAPEAFREPVHGRIWAIMAALAASGQRAEIGTIGRRLTDDEGFGELGGIGYLADLATNAPPSSMAAHFAGQVRELAARRQVLDLAETTARELRGQAPTAEAIEALESGLLAVQRGARRVGIVSAADAASAALADLDGSAIGHGGIATGLAPLDDHLGRLQADELILIAGRPGMGKSALASCIALNIARRGQGVIEINAEMSVAQMTRRHLSDLAFSLYGHGAATYKDLKRRAMTPPQRGQTERAARELAALPMAMVKRTGLTVAALRSMARRQAAQWARQGIALGAITVDHVGLLAAEDGGRDRYRDQTQIAISMKQLADELRIPVIALVQLSRAPEARDNKRPQLSDLRDTGAWEENADVAIGCYREAYYAAKEIEPKGDEAWNDWSRRRNSPEVEAILMKVREGQETTIKLWASIGHNAIRGDNPAGGAW